MNKPIGFDFWNNEGFRNYQAKKFIASNDLNYQFEILKRTKIKFKNVLELGPGNGLALARFIKEGAKVSAIDYSQKFVDKISKKYAGEFICANYQEGIKNLKVASFDLIFAAWSIHYFYYREFKKFLKSCVDLMMPEGIFFGIIGYGNKLCNQTPGYFKQYLTLNFKTLSSALPQNLKLIFAEVATRTYQGEHLCFMLKKIS